MYKNIIAVAYFRYGAAFGDVQVKLNEFRILFIFKIQNYNFKYTHTMYKYCYGDT